MAVEAPQKPLVCVSRSRHDANGRGAIARKDNKVPLQIQARILRDLENSMLTDPMPGFELPKESSGNWDKSEKRRRVQWRETDLRRAIVAAKRAGLRFYSVDIAPDGTISIVVGEQNPGARMVRLRERMGKSTKH
jgi:hypothetical protein